VASAKVRVLVVASKFPPEYSGAGWRAHRTYLRLRRKYNVEHRVLCSSMVEFSYRTRRYELDGVEVARISSPWKRAIAEGRVVGRPLARRMRHVLAAIDEGWRTILFLLRHGGRFDVVHCFGYSWSGGVAVVWAGLSAKQVIRELVTELSRPDDPKGLRWMVRWALRERGLIVAISPALAEVAKSLGYRRIWCRPNPVDESKFVMNRERKYELRQRLTPFGPDDVVLVDLSKYIRPKNKEILPEMLTLLPERYKLVIAGPLDGSGPELHRRIVDRVAQLRLQHRVHIETGFTDAPEHYFQMADVFLFPSSSDGLGTPVLEALACGTPVVATRIPGVTDWWIRDGVNGFLTEPTAGAFAEAVAKAAAIPLDTVDASSIELRRAAATSVVDAQYYQHLQTSTASASG
jgi:glycosyltransferase involved in cell wall biosynthesis